jgi:hypothetical protein
VEFSEIASEIRGTAEALKYEVTTLAKCFAENAFFGDKRHFPHAHYGYIMACMGQLDLMSKCEIGPSDSPGGQTPRMQSFMERYLYARKVDEHRVAIQLMRHTLMHTGALRYLYEKQTETAYTWRIHFGDSFPTHFEHYTLTVEDPTYQDHLLAAVDGKVAAVKALNIQLTELAADIQRVAETYTKAMSAAPALRNNCERVYPAIRVQPLK